MLDIDLTAPGIADNLAKPRQGLAVFAHPGKTPLLRGLHEISLTR